MTDATKSERLDSFEKVQAWLDEQPIHANICTAACCLAANQNWWWVRERVRNQTRRQPLQRILGEDHPYFVHTSKSDPLKIAYTPSKQYGEQDRQVVTTVGRFLTKHFSGSFSPEEIRHHADAHRARYGEARVHFAFSADAIERVYRNGPNSCMSHATEEIHHRLTEHPVRMYDGPDTVVAYIEAEPGRYTARAVVHIGRSPMTYSRVYGDVELLKDRLNALGFEQQLDLDKARLRREELASGGLICPYVDGISCARDDGEFLHIDCNGHISCSQADGVTGVEDEDEGRYCYHCQENRDDDGGNEDMQGNWICRTCSSDWYYYAVCNVYGDEALVHMDDAVLVNDDYYWRNSRVLTAHGIHEVDGEYHHEEDLTQLANGDWALDDDACYPIRRNGAYLCEDCTELPDGSWVHDDDLTEIDGVQMHVDDVPEETPTTEPA